jgi:hypothetical protein
LSFLRFFIWLIAITLIQVGIVMLLSQHLPVNDVLQAILFFALLTVAIYPIAMTGTGRKDGYTFITTAYISIGLRFVLSMCYIVYYKQSHDTYHKGFIFAFFVSYIFYTVFEITSVTAKLRPDLKAKQSSNESDNT